MVQMSFKNKCFIFLLVSLIPDSSYAQSPQSCVSSPNQPRICKMITACPVLMDLIRNSVNNPGVVKYLQSLQCGQQGRVPKVCCLLDGTSGYHEEFNNNTLEESPQAMQESPLLPDTTQCGHSSEVRAVSGNVTEIFEFPWMALLQYNTTLGKGFHCGGTLISSQYILTAAHCIKRKETQNDMHLTSVTLGEWSISNADDCTDDVEDKLCSDPVLNIPIESTVVHENYNPEDVNQHNDIALIRLAEKVNFTHWVLPVCLPIFNQRLLNKNFDLFDMYIVGWGTDDVGSKSDVKLKSRRRIVSHPKCKATYKDAGVTIRAGQACAGGMAKNHCNGDSGGPLAYQDAYQGAANWYIYGVDSFGLSDCGVDGLPKVYTNVGLYGAWILSNIKP